MWLSVLAHHFFYLLFTYKNVKPLKTALEGIFPQGYQALGCVKLSCCPGEVLGIVLFRQTSNPLVSDSSGATNEEVRKGLANRLGI